MPAPQITGNRRVARITRNHEFAGGGFKNNPVVIESKEIGPKGSHAFGPMSELITFVTN